MTSSIVSTYIITPLIMLTVGGVVLWQYWNSGNEQLQFLSFFIFVGALLATPFLILWGIKWFFNYKDYENQKKIFKPLKITQVIPIGVGGYMGGSIYHSAKLSNGQTIDMIPLSYKEGDKVYIVNGRLWLA